MQSSIIAPKDRTSLLTQIFIKQNASNNYLFANSEPVVSPQQVTWRPVAEADSVNRRVNLYNWYFFTKRLYSNTYLQKMCVVRACNNKKDNL